MVYKGGLVIPPLKGVYERLIKGRGGGRSKYGIQSSHTNDCRILKYGSR
ncbi:hypothetical protein ES708_25110 [subsurface metagenome]